MNWHDLIRELEGFDEREFFGPVREQEVIHAEEELGCSFPPEYRQFLLELGAGSVSSESFVGLGGPKYLDVVWMTRTLRQKSTKHPFPSQFLPLRTDGFGNYDCIDTSQPTTKGEYAIVEWIHEAGGQKGRTVAQGWFEWFHSILQMIREIEQ